MVAGGRVHGQVVDEEAVGLVEREVPVVVLVAGLHGGSPGAVVDVVAEADEGADRVGGGEALHGAGHPLLPLAVAVLVDADPVVAPHEERDRLVVVGGGVGAEATLVALWCWAAARSGRRRPPSRGARRPPRPGRRR